MLLSASCDEENDDNTFVDGLCAMLRDVNTATSRNVVSLPMGHLIAMLDGSRFEYSHECVNLFVSQLDATLEGRPVDARRRFQQTTTSTDPTTSTQMGFTVMPIS